MVGFIEDMILSTNESMFDLEKLDIDELIASFDITRLTKSNSLFDRGKLIAFNTEHLKMLPKEKLLCSFQGIFESHRFARRQSR